MNKQLQTILHNNMKKHIQTKRTKQYCMSENDTKKEIQKVIDWTKCSNKNQAWSSQKANYAGKTRWQNIFTQI